MKPHKHAEVIKAWADGAEVQIRCGDKDFWKDTDSPAFGISFEYRVKPAEPERSYPSISLRIGQTSEIWAKAPDGHHECVIFIANAALRHACDNGQIVTREEFDRAVGDRAKRDMAVAEAVNNEWSMIGSLSAGELSLIIKGVTHV